MGVVNRTKLRGIETFWGESPGPLSAALTFRVGVIDESLPTRGITHMVEHLALQRFGRQSYSYNGFVDHVRTTFVVSGSSEEIVGFLGEVTEALRELPLDRLEHERQILLTETERYSSGPLDWALAIRYGPRGPGLLAQEEFGLHRITTDEVREWALRHFTAQNAAMWFSGPPPEDLHLEVPNGRLIEVPLVEEVPLKLPAWYEVGERGVALASVVPRSPTAPTLSSVLERRLQKDLRYEKGISYEAAVVYMPVGRDQALQGVWTDTLKENAEQARTAVMSAIDDLVSKGPSSEELDQHMQDMERIWADPNAVPSILDVASVGYLLKPSDADRDVLAEARAVTSDDVRGAAELLRSRMLLGVPRGSKVGRGFHVVPEGSKKKLRGKTFQPSRRIETAFTNQRLVQGDKGVTLIHERGKFVSIEYDSCEGLLQWSDGSRVLFGADGFMIGVDPKGWRGGKRIVEELDRRLADRAIPLKSEPPPAGEEGVAQGWYLRAALISGFFALRGLILLVDPEDRFPGWWIGPLIMVLVLVPIALFTGWRWYSARSGPSSSGGK